MPLALAFTSHTLGYALTCDRRIIQTGERTSRADDYRDRIAGILHQMDMLPLAPIVILQQQPWAGEALEAMQRAVTFWARMSRPDRDEPQLVPQTEVYKALTGKSNGSHNDLVLATMKVWKLEGRWLGSMTWNALALSWYIKKASGVQQ